MSTNTKKKHGTGAAVVFGATGGVMDAALRSAYYLITGKEPKPDAFSAVRGMDSWKEAVFTIPGAGTAEAHSSGSLSAMIGCNCLVELPAGSGPVTPGEEVEVLSFVQ